LGQILTVGLFRDRDPVTWLMRFMETSWKRHEIEQRMDALAREYHETKDPEIPATDF
jgi:hypothetical protein